MPISIFELRLKIGHWRMPQSINRRQNEQETMTEDVTVPKPVSAWKLRLMGALATGSGLVAVVSAGTINDSVGPILDSLPPLFVSLVALVVAAIPIMIILAIVGFILGLFAAILGKIRM